MIEVVENAEYHYSKDRQRVVEGMISNLTEKLSCADVIDITKLSGDVSDFGATVLVIDEDTEKKISYKLLSEFESDISKNIISVDSPIGKALLGRKVGDFIEIKVPNGTKNFEVLEISWN